MRQSKKMRTDRALYRVFCGKARTSEGGSSCQFAIWEGTYALIVTDSSLKTTFGGIRLGTDRSSAAGGVRLAAAKTIGRPRSDFWSYQDSTDRQEAKVFRAHAAPHGVCDNSINALKLLTNQQKDDDSPVKMVVPE